MISPLAVLSIVGGLTYLFMGGDLLVRGSISLARRYGISPTVIGATVVALGTSLPELIVAVAAATSDHGGIALGNVVGSNIANVLLVLGVPALIAPIVARRSAMQAPTLFLLGVSAVFVAMSFAAPIGRLDGLGLLGILAAAAALTLSGRLPLLDLSAEEEEYVRTLGLPERAVVAWSFIAFGAGALPLGAQLTLDGVTQVAREASIPETAIAASAVALGTSLPELSVSVLAALHSRLDMAIGNVVGSNALNILFVVGVTAVIAPIQVPASLMSFDLWVLLALAVLLFGIVVRGTSIGRGLGAGFITAYALYIWMIF